MVKKFLVTGNWVDKSSGKPVSGICEITGGINKNGQPYEIANTDNRETPIDGTYAVGTIITANMNFAVQANPGTPAQAAPKTGTVPAAPRAKE